MENVSENIFKIAEYLKYFVQNRMLTKLKQRKFEDFFTAYIEVIAFNVQAKILFKCNSFYVLWSDFCVLVVNSVE
jgi:hypothetical protein